MASILRQQVAGKQIDGRPAGFAIEHLDPQKRLHRHVRVPVARAGGPVVATDLGAQGVDERIGGLLVGREVDRLDLLADDPGRHRIDVEAIHVASDAIRLDERRPASHERVGDTQPGKVVGSKEEVVQATLAELGEHEAAEQGARAACEPLVDTDDRAVVLLDLLLSKRHFGDQRNIEAPLDTHDRLPAPD